jgi:hypothetical protein
LRKWNNRKGNSCWWRGKAAGTTRGPSSRDAFEIGKRGPAMSYQKAIIFLLTFLCVGCNNRLNEITNDIRFRDYNFHPLKKYRCQMGNYSVHHAKVSGSIGIGFYEGLEWIEIHEHRYLDKEYVPLFLTKDYQSRPIFCADPTRNITFRDINVTIYVGRVKCKGDNDRSGLVFFPHDIITFFTR